MKRILFFLSLLIPFIGATQFPVNSTIGSANSTVLARGILAADSAIQLRTNFTDTTQANLGVIDQVSGSFIRTGTDVWLRNQSATAWVLINGGGDIPSLQQVTDVGATTTNDITLTNADLYLSNTTTASPEGIIYKGGVPWMHDFTPAGWSGGLTKRNLFLGKAGNLTMTSSGSGSSNIIAIGEGAAGSNTTGFDYTAIGVGNLGALTDGGDHASLGNYALNSCTSCTGFSVVGYNAFADNVTGADGSAVGYDAFANSTGSRNSGIGVNVFRTLVAGNDNFGGGFNAGSGITGGTGNVVIGPNVTFTSGTYDSLLVLGNGKGQKRLWVNGNGAWSFNAGSSFGTAGQVPISNGPGAAPSWSSLSGVLTLAAIGSSPNANAMTLSSSTLNLEPASASFGGVVTTGTQSFAGAKTFTNATTTLTNTIFNDDGNRMRISPPTGQLDVYTAGQTTDVTFFNSDASDGLKFDAENRYIYATANMKLTGGTQVGSSLALQSTSGVGTTDFINFLVGNNGATEAMRILNNGYVGIGLIDPAMKLQISSGRFGQAMGASVAAANDLTLGNDGNLFTITGNTQINAITTAGWQAGSKISFIFTGTPTIKNNTAGTIGTATMLLAGRADFTAAAGDYIAFQYDGTNWYETNRKLAASGGVYAFSNGLTESPVGTVKLGGTLTGATSIATGSNTLTVSTGTAGVNPLAVTGTTGIGLVVTTSSGAAVAGSSSTGTAGSFTTAGATTVFAQNTGSSVALYGTTAGKSLQLETNPAATNTVVTIADIGRKTTGTAADGIGGSIDLNIESDNGTAPLANQITSKWTTAANATRTSQFIIAGVNSATTGDILTLNGNKSIKANGYGAGTFTGTATKWLAVDADGDIIEENAPSGGSSLFPTTGTGSATGNVTGDLNANGLTITDFSTITLSGTGSSGAVTVTNSNLDFIIGNASATATFRLLPFGTDIYFDNPVAGTTYFRGYNGVTAEILSISPTGSVFNDPGLSTHDVRIEGDTDANLFFTDASADKIGIGTNAPTTKLHVAGRFAATQGADVASAAGAIALGTDGNSFELTGTAAVTLISNSGWMNGSVVTLLFTSTASLTDGTANSGTDIGLELAGNANFTGSAGATLTLILSEIGGTQRWREMCRSVQ